VILEKVTHALRNCGINAKFFPTSDIALSDNRKKFSGNAQRRRRNYLLHHGTILYDFDLFSIEKYLKMPKEIPPYRDNRPHIDFLTNINVNPQEIKEAFKREFYIDVETGTISDYEGVLMEDFSFR